MLGTGDLRMTDQYYVGIRFDIKEGQDCIELIRILEANGYECRLLTNTARIDGTKRSVAVKVPVGDEYGY